MGLTWSEEDERDTCTKGKRWLTWKVRMNASLEEDGGMEERKEVGEEGKEEGGGQPVVGFALLGAGDEAVMHVHHGASLKRLTCVAEFLSHFLPYTTYVTIVIYTTKIFQY